MTILDREGDPQAEAADGRVDRPPPRRVRRPAAGSRYRSSRSATIQALRGDVRPLAATGPLAPVRRRRTSRPRPRPRASGPGLDHHPTPTDTRSRLGPRGAAPAQPRAGSVGRPPSPTVWRCDRCDRSTSARRRARTEERLRARDHDEKRRKAGTTPGRAGSYHPARLHVAQNLRRVPRSRVTSCGCAEACREPGQVTIRDATRQLSLHNVHAEFSQPQASRVAADRRSGPAPG